jgi:riboflavin-specific deaminase-like protein
MSIREPNRLISEGDADSAWVWGALMAAAGLARRQKGLENGRAYGLDGGRLCPVAASDSRALMIWQEATGWTRTATAPRDVQALLDLYLPICNVSPNSPLSVGHLGQGLDGYIATSSGDSHYVTGPENILHLHRMRALCDAVIVGAGTVSSDDPRLTTRRAKGEHPVRVILDPSRRLASTHRVFSDNEAATLLVCDRARLSETHERFAEADLLGIPLHGGRFDLEALIRALHSRNLFSVFVEGGGHTVSAFLQAGLLDRLQVAVAPLMTGVGRPGLRLAEKRQMKECLRPSRRIFSMGEDILFDFDLRSDAEAGTDFPATGGLRRIL